MLFQRFRKPRPAAALVAAPCDHRRCDELGALPQPFSPLIREMMEAYCHTRPIATLARIEPCSEEYRIMARAIIHDLLEGWNQQSQGLGTIEDLLLEPYSPTAWIPPTRTAGSPLEHRATS